MHIYYIWWNHLQKLGGVVINQYPPYDYLPTFLLEDEDTSQVVDNFKKTQEPLGTEFNNVLYDNIEDLYEV